METTLIMKKKEFLSCSKKGTCILYIILFRQCFFVSTQRVSCILVSTDVAAMGLDVPDLNLSVNIGKYVLHL